MENNTCYNIEPGDGTLASCISIKAVREMMDMLTKTGPALKMTIMFVNPTEAVLTIDGVEFKLKQMTSVEPEPTTIVSIADDTLQSRALVVSKFAAESGYSGAQRFVIAS